MEPEWAEERQKGEQSGRMCYDFWIGHRPHSLPDLGCVLLIFGNHIEPETWRSTGACEQRVDLKHVIC